MKNKEKLYKVYIASPYTLGMPKDNVKRQVVAASMLIHSGFIPFAPLLYYYVDKFSPVPYEYWLKMDFEWVLTCDAVLRLSGRSYGADKECRFAKRNNIPVFHDIIKLQQYFIKKRFKIKK